MEVSPWTLTLPEVDITLQEKVNKSDLPHLANTETKILINKYIGQTHIYTDGSKDPDSGRVASAVVIPSIQYEKIDRLTNNTSIYTAELLAIRNAMCWIHDSDIIKAVIFSDSLSSLISLKSNNSQSRPDLLNEIILLYNKVLNLGKQVTIVWCPAHIGI
jgi:ribonuclease HI